MISPIDYPRRGDIMQSHQTQGDTQMQVIAHPTKPGFWTILIGGHIYGAYDCRAVAVGVMLSY